MKKFSKLAALPALALVGANSAFAAIPSDVTTALTDLKDDLWTAGGLILAAAVVVASIGLIRRILRA